MFDEKWQKIVGSVDVVAPGPCPTVTVLRGGVEVDVNVEDVLPDEKVVKR